MSLGGTLTRLAAFLLKAVLWRCLVRDPECRNGNRYGEREEKSNADSSDASPSDEEAPLLARVQEFGALADGLPFGSQVDQVRERQGALHHQTLNVGQLRGVRLDFHRPGRFRQGKQRMLASRIPDASGARPPGLIVRLRPQGVPVGGRVEVPGELRY